MDKSKGKRKKGDDGSGSRSKKGDDGSGSKSPRSPKVNSSPKKRYASPRKSVSGSNRDGDSVSRLKPIALGPPNLASSAEECKESPDQIGPMKKVTGLTSNGSPNKVGSLPQIVENHLGDLSKPSTEKTRLEFIMTRPPQNKAVVVPFGPRFQVEVPQWTEPVTRLLAVNNDPLDRERWEANRVWPAYDVITETPLNEIGKGRADSCNCTAPGSSVCIKSHIDEKNLKLQGEIGSAFRSWKFDEMGEAVSNAWTKREQNTFSRLKYDETFWEKVGKRFSTVSRKSIVSYLYNVFVPRKFGYHAENGLEDINSDCEEIEDSDVTAKGNRNHLKPPAR